MLVTRRGGTRESVSMRRSVGGHGHAVGRVNGDTVREELPDDPDLERRIVRRAGGEEGICVAVADAVGRYLRARDRRERQPCATQTGEDHELDLVGHARLRAVQVIPLPCAVDDAVCVRVVDKARSERRGRDRVHGGVRRVKDLVCEREGSARQGHRNGEDGGNGERQTRHVTSFSTVSELEPKSNHPPSVLPDTAERRAQTRQRKTLAAVPPGARGFMTGWGSEHRSRRSRDLVKRYPKSPVNAVDGVSFEVARREIFGLLGPNGAGKTTTVGVLTTRVRPTSGSAAVAGIDVVRNPVEARSALAVIPQRSNLDRALSIRANLVFHAAYHGVPAKERNRRADELLEQFGLLDRANQKPDMFSGGQSQRVMIARALMHSPQVLFLDEPSTGLDPAARLFVWDRLRELRDRGVTLVLTTHDMDEAAALADRVGIMDHGTLLALDTPDGADAVGADREHDRADHAAAATPRRRSRSSPSSAPLPSVEVAERIASELRTAKGPPPGRTATCRVRLYVTGDAPLLVAPAAGVLAAHGSALADVKLGTPTLEDVFIHLTGRTLR